MRFSPVLHSQLGSWWTFRTPGGSGAKRPQTSDFRREAASGDFSKMGPTSMDDRVAKFGGLAKALLESQGWTALSEVASSDEKAGATPRTLVDWVVTMFLIQPHKPKNIMNHSVCHTARFWFLWSWDVGMGLVPCEEAKQLYCSLQVTIGCPGKKVACMKRKRVQIWKHCGWGFCFHSFLTRLPCTRM